MNDHAARRASAADARLVRELKTALLRVPAAPDERLRGMRLAALSLALRARGEPFGRRDVLVLSAAGRPDARIPLRELPVTLGRGAEADYRIEGPGVSRVHARLERDGLFISVVDLSSTNGTFLNGERLLAQHLQSKDTLVLGETHLTVRRG